MTPISPTPQALLDEVMAVHSADHGDAQIFHPSSGLLEMVAWRGISDEAARRWKWVDPRKDTTVCCRAFRLGQPVYISDVSYDPPYAPYLAETLASGIRAVHSIPVLFEGRCVAVISPMYSAPRVLPASALAASQALISKAGSSWFLPALAAPSMGSALPDRRSS